MKTLEFCINYTIMKLYKKTGKHYMTYSIHIKAFLTNFEITCEAGILALAADILWIIHDIIFNGMSIWYFFVFLGLFLGLVLTGYALYRHHKYYTHRIARKLNTSFKASVKVSKSNKRILI